MNRSAQTENCPQFLKVFEVSNTVLITFKYMILVVKCEIISSKDLGIGNKGRIKL